MILNEKTNKMLTFLIKVFLFLIVDKSMIIMLKDSKISKDTYNNGQKKLRWLTFIIFLSIVLKCWLIV